MNDPVLADQPPDGRLDSWKEIAAYLRRDVSTVQRWEKREGMPVRRHVHDRLGSVYALRSELDAWVAGRNPQRAMEQSGTTDIEPAQSTGQTRRTDRQRAFAGSHARRIAAALVAAAAALAVIAWWWFTPGNDVRWRDRLMGGERQFVTDFDGSEVAAALSRDGRLVAFLSDRDGRMDVWVTQLGTGQFYNLTRGRVRELVNPAVRTLGFSPDGALVTFWARGVEGAANDGISFWAIPTLGGQPRPYLEGAAELDWSSDGSRLTYHTPGPGDPMFVRDASPAASDRPVFSAASGLHAHFPTWSPDGSAIYFVQGSLPDATDIYRVRLRDRGVERITTLDAGVSHPVFLDPRTLAFLARAKDESAARLYVVDVERRAPQVVDTGFDRYTSLAASADGRRLVATLANPKGTLWRLPVADQPVGTSAASPLVLPTGRGVAPRLGPGYLLYVSKKGASDSLWKLAGGAATELWSMPDTRIVGGPALDAQARRVAVTVEQRGRTLLYVMNADGTDARVVSGALAVQGSPAWAPDGRVLAVGASLDGARHLFRVPLDGLPSSVIEDYAVDPVWSPAGDFIVYSTADIGTRIAVKAVTGDGRRYPAVDFTLTRGARRVRFFQDQRALVLMRGDIGHKDLWLVDLDSGRERQLTELPLDFLIRDFDLSTDGRELVVERLQEHSDIVLIDLAARK